MEKTYLFIICTFYSYKKYIYHRNKHNIKTIESNVYCFYFMILIETIFIFITAQEYSTM